MDFNDSGMSFDAPEQEQVNPFNESLAAQAAADVVMFTGDPNLYMSVKNELLQTGSSRVYSQVLAQAKAKDNSVALSTAAKVAESLEQPKEERASIATELLQDSQNKTLESAALEEQAERYQFTPDDIDKVDSIQSFLDLSDEGRRELEILIAQEFERHTGDSSTLGLVVTGILAGLVPVNETIFTGRVKGKFEKRFKLRDFSLTSLNDLRKEFNAIPTNEEKAEFIQEFSNVLAETGALFGVDDAFKVGSLHLVTQDFLEGVDIDDRKLQNAFLTIATVLDYAALGGAIKGGVAAYRGARTLTKLDKLAAVNPKNARAVAVEGVTNPEVAQAAGQAPADIVLDYLVPKWAGTDGKAVDMATAPPKVREALEVANKYGEDALDRMRSHGYIASDAERNTMVRQIQEHFKTQPDVRYVDGESSITMGDDFIQVNAVFNRTQDGTGWKTAEQAVQDGRALFPEAEVIAKPRQHVLTGGEGVSTQGATDFVLQIKYAKPYDDFTGMTFGPNDVLLSGKFWDYLADPATRYSQALSRPSSRAFDLAKGVQAQLDEMVRPLTKLNNKSKGRVIGWLDEGMSSKPNQTEGFVFSPRELQVRGASDAEMSSYYGARKLADTLYIANNRRFRDDFIRQGYNTVVKTDQGDLPFRQANVAALPRTVTEAFDPTLGRLVPLTERTNIGELFEELSTGDRLTRYVVLDSARTDVLPRAVLKYDPGYVPTKYQDTYIIKLNNQRKVVDGVQETFNGAIGAAQNLRHAKEILQRRELQRLSTVQRLERSLQEATEAEAAVIKQNLDELKAQKYEIEFDKSVSPVQAVKNEVDIEALKGRLFFSPKGQRLEGITESGLAEIQDPIQALSRARSITARAAVYGPLVKSMKTRFMNTYKDLVDADAIGKGFPGSEKQIFSNVVSQRKRVADAQSLWRWIDSMESPAEEAKTFWQQSWLGLAEKLEGGTLANLAIAVSKRDPIRLARGFNFVTMLALNPARQLFLQSQQFLTLTSLSPKYILTGAIARDYSALMLGYMGRPFKGARGNFPYDLDTVAEKAAKTMGVSVQEYKATVKAFRESGLPDAIDSHMLSHDAVVRTSDEFSKTQLKLAATKAKNFLGKAVSIPRKFGFDLGEFNNLVATWLVARNIALRTTGTTLTSRRTVDAVAATARQYALDMTAQGSFAHQRGALSLMTQFLSIQQKMLLAMSPFRVGNQAFTRTERARIAGTQLLLFGVTGLGLKEAWSAAKDKLGLTVPEQADKWITAGLYERVFNGVISSVGDDTDISVSASIAPGGGIYDSFGGMISDLVSGDRSTLQILAGPTSSSYDRISTAVRKIAWAASDPDLSTPGKALRSAEAVASIASGFNSYHRFIMAQNLQASVDRFGDPIASNHFKERFLKALIGTGTTTEERYWDTLRDVKKRKRAVEETARMYLNFYLEDITRFDLNTTSTLEDKEYLVYSNLNDLAQHIMMQLGPEEGHAVWQETQDILKRERQEFGIDSIGRAVNGMLERGEIPDPARELENLQRLGFYDEKTAKEVQERIETLFDQTSEFILREDD